VSSPVGYRGTARALRFEFRASVPDKTGHRSSGPMHIGVLGEDSLTIRRAAGRSRGGCCDFGLDLGMTLIYNEHTA